MNGPVQLGLALLQCLKSTVLLQRDHDGFNLARTRDHLMVANVGARVQGILAHVVRVPAAVSVPRSLLQGMCSKVLRSSLTAGSTDPADGWGRMNATGCTASNTGAAAVLRIDD